MSEPAVVTIGEGRYEVGEVIGSGGMAEVRRGRDLRIGRDVAIKLLRPDLGRDPAFQNRFRREAQAAASLNSAAIVAVFDTGEDVIDGRVTPYIVMEYVKGRTLREVLNADGRMLPGRALQVTVEICHALEQAHAAGIVHRDIKPANVMLTETGQVKVMDFGIARALTGSSTMTQTATVIGTAYYLSPEQARGEHVDARSDIYSTGCLLYELLTGAPPFTGDSAVAVAYQHVREEPIPPSTIEADVPPDIDAIVLVAMAKNPVNRYASAAEMRADLERSLAGQPVLATPVRRDEPTTVTVVPPTAVVLRTPPRRRRGLAYLLLLLATAAVFVVALFVARNLLSGGHKEVNTPNLVGQTLAEATTTLKNEGLALGTVTRRFTGNDDAGKVLSQSPAPQFLLSQGDRVSLVVSRGVRIVTVPNGLVGLSTEQARTALTAAGLTVGDIVSRNSDAPAGQVLATRPRAGAQVPSGRKVTLVVSNAQVKVPDVTGETLFQATAILQEAGFVVSHRRNAVFVPGKDGLVITQSPGGETFAASGSTVIVYIDVKPKPPPTPTPPPTPSGTPSTSPTPSTSTSPSASPTPS
jgi:beta-lactam-binding protein with PASTA domain/tRNA A-37 threonylcarbamoyl transferase component Bud32